MIGDLHEIVMGDDMPEQSPWMGPEQGAVNACSPTPSTRTPVANLAERVRRTVKFFDGFLAEAGIDSHIDEIAVMFNEEEQKFDWLKSALAEEGVFAFNHATDHVNTSPLETSYSVEYTFLQSNALKWRIEAMRLLAGFSPLHEAMQRRGAPWQEHVVHASFKVHSPREWLKVVQILNTEGTNAQMCHSTYGRFGYWLLNEDILPPGVERLYLKPRLNERDGQ